MLVAGRDDFHLVAGLDDVVQGHQALVHLGGDGLVADFRMDLVREVQHRGAFLDDALLTLRGEHVDLRAREVVVDDVQQLQGVHVRINQDFLDALQPEVHLAVVLAHIPVLLIGPVGGDALFGDVVHAPGADLDFHPDAGRAQEGAVQSLVAVGLGVLHPVAQAFWHIAVNACDDGEYVIALVAFRFTLVLGRIEDNPDGI